MVKMVKNDNRLCQSVAGVAVRKEPVRKDPGFKFSDQSAFPPLGGAPGKGHERDNNVTTVVKKTSPRRREFQ